MKITLLNVLSNKRGLINKDISGGFGTVSNFGTSFVARALTYFKKWGIRYPVVSFAYLAAIFERNGHKVEVLTNEVPKNADVVFIYSSLVDYKQELKFASLIKKKGKAKVGFIGTFCSVKPEIFWGHSDFVVVGEPESLAQKMSSGWIPNGIVKSDLIEDLDSLPFPNWKVFKLDKFKYRPYFLNLKSKNFFPILSSRGCSFSCAYYCPYTVITGRKWRKRSPQNVIEEIIYLVQNYNAGTLLFRDPVFTLDKERTRKICEGIIKNRLKIRYVCETHLATLNKNVIDLMYNSGLRAIKVGVESASESILKNAGRKTDNIKHQEEMLDYCDKKGIGVTAFYILALPEDTQESILRTIEYAKKLNTERAQFTVCTPYPGTSFYDDVKDLISTENYEDFDIYHLVFRHPRLTPEQVNRLKNYAYQSYYLRWKWLTKILKRKIRIF